uniref:Carboxylesterase type B domain-containing protein n=1 Tax=Eptatretus burgeri TaxID=7764 RepID=A0A8C4NFK0_EPTBU
MVQDSKRGLSVRGCALIAVGLILICLLSATIAYFSGTTTYTLTDLRLPFGSIRGLHTTAGYSFLGVPYAQYPARWTAPQSPISWNDTLLATKHGPACPQLARPITSETCLFVNVWSPTIKRDALLPVVVWFHGGSLMVGSGADPGAKPWDSLALETQTVYVSFNYRLGVFGFLAIKELSQKRNYGFLDQIAALKWVKDNIEHFGGDPKRVTLFGHEAGAISISALMLSPLAEGLFSAAIFTGCSFTAFTDLKEAEEQQASIFQSTSCHDLDCLESLSTETLLQVCKSYIVLLMSQIFFSFDFTTTKMVKGAWKLLQYLTVYSIVWDVIGWGRRSGSRWRGWKRRRRRKRSDDDDTTTMVMENLHAISRIVRLFIIPMKSDDHRKQWEGKWEIERDTSIHHPYICIDNIILLT